MEKRIRKGSGALVVGNLLLSLKNPEIALSVQWSRANQSVAVSGSQWQSVAASGRPDQTRQDSVNSVNSVNSVKVKV